jgi:hypothetical protein
MRANLLRIDVDPDSVLARQFTALEQKNLPFAVMQAANNTAFAVREEWKRRMPQVFDQPTALTRNAIVYRKATKANMAAEVLVRDDAFKGTPPSRYLQAQVKGGQRLMKPFENRLAAQGILPSGLQAVPGKGVHLDAYGNIPGGVLNRVLSQLGARFDPAQNETETSRGRRQKREAKKTRGDYFAVKAKRGGLRPGVYQRVRTAFGSGVAIILAFVRKATYKPRYRIFDLAERLHARQFKFQFERELEKAVQTSKFRGRG